MSNNKQYAVLMTSAINTKFGVYSADQRFRQTMNSILSVKNKIPNSTIFLLESAGQSLTNDQQLALSDLVDHIFDFTTDNSVVGLYNSTDNWDVVKNVTEVMCFILALRTLINSGQLENYERVFKVSGRYVLNDNFDIEYYQSYKVKPCIVINQKKPSHFPSELTGIDYQFMSRLWSWPASLNGEILDVYDQTLKYMYERLAQGKYADIEHCLYKFLDKDKILEKQIIGIQGNIGPNGASVNE